jgi:hypothetical protein
MEKISFITLAPGLWRGPEDFPEWPAWRRRWRASGLGVKRLEVFSASALRSSRWGQALCPPRTGVNVVKRFCHKWVETNQSHFRIYRTDICISHLMVLRWRHWYGCQIRMFTDVRWVGFLPPFCHIMQWWNELVWFSLPVYVGNGLVALHLSGVP